MAIPLIAFKLASLVAPTLIGLLKGPKAEEAAQKVVNVARQVTGIDDPEAAAAALEADAAKATEYKIALLKHEEFAAQLAADERKHERETDLATTQGAQTRDIEVRKLTPGGHNWRADLLAVLAVGYFGYSLHLLLTQALPDGAERDLVVYLLGQLTGIVLAIYTFEFGSSQGSVRNGAMVRQSLEKVVGLIQGKGNG